MTKGNTICNFKNTLITVLLLSVGMLLISCSKPSAKTLDNKAYEVHKEIDNSIYLSVFSQYAPKYDVIVDEEKSTYYYYLNNELKETGIIDNSLKEKTERLKALASDYNNSDKTFMFDYKTVILEFNNNRIVFNYHKSGDSEIDEIIDELLNYSGNT